MPRSRLMSICPPGAIRLVPTLMTTLIFVGLHAGANSLFLRCQELQPGVPGGQFRPTPAGRDNLSILPLEWLSGKVKNLATWRSANLTQIVQSDPSRLK